MRSSWFLGFHWPRRRPRNRKPRRAIRAISSSIWQARRSRSCLRRTARCATVRTASARFCGTISRWTRSRGSSPARTGGGCRREQKASYEKLFSEWVLKTYSVRLGGYSGEHFQVLRSTPAGKNDVIVYTRISKSGGDGFDANWRVRRDGDRYKIIDIYVEGVSMAITQRSEFEFDLPAPRRRRADRHASRESDEAEQHVPGLRSRPTDAPRATRGFPLPAAGTLAGRFLTRDSVARRRAYPPTNQSLRGSAC